MLSLIIAGLVIAWVGYMIVKKYFPQTILIIAGIVLLAAAAIMGVKGGLLAGKASTGSIWLDVIQTFTSIAQSRVGGLGLMIMSIAGFSAYMDYVGASRALFAIVGSPLKKIKSPYVLLVLAFYVSQILVLFIPSHAGLGLLLMVTMYPILIRSGVSKMSALGVIGCAQYMDVGPGSGNAILAANTAKIDVATFFVEYQLPIFITTTLVLGVVHYFTQRYWDKKEGFVVGQSQDTDVKDSEQAIPPLSYAILPILPMILILGFSPIFKSPIKMDVVTAMLISTLISMVFEYFRTGNVKQVFESIKNFFNGMGNSFANTISLIVAGEFFAAGLMKVGAVDALIKAAQDAGLGAKPMTIAVCLIIAFCAFLMGSGNAAFFSFAALAPKIAEFMKVPVIDLILPMQIMTSFGRVVSPITAALIAIAGVAGVSSVQIVKRTAIPMAVAALINIGFILFR